MAIGARQTNRETAGTETTGHAVEPRSKKKRSAHLVTADDALWPQFGAAISSDIILTQVDGIEQFLATIEPEHAGIVIWDARGDTDYATQLARIQRHSSRLVVIVLDLAAMRSQWKRLTEQNQIVCLVALPFTAEHLSDAMGRAYDEVQTRTALMGTREAGAAAQASPSSKRSRTPLVIGAGVFAIALAAAFGFYEFQHGSPTVEHRAPTPASTTVPTPVASATHRPGSDDPVDSLLDKATQAMLERRYIEPAENSALAYYRAVLGLDADNAEAKQGLDRLEGLLATKAQTALDQQHFESALQALEIARSISRDDPRLQTLDSRLSKMRSELGSTVIQAAINAGNYERAAALLDEAAQAKTLPAPQLAQLRNDMARRRDEMDEDRLIKMAEARVQQDRLIDPSNDSAAHWFTLAKKAGNSSSTLTSPALAAAIHDFSQHLMQAARTAIEQNRLADADRLLNEAKLRDAPAAAIAELQHDVAVARSQQGRANEGQRIVDLVKARMAQGNLLEPDQDSALFYLSSLKTADPQNASLPELSHAVQSQLVARAGSLLDGGHSADAQTLLQSALKLGPSADASALADKISRTSQAPSNAVTAELKLLKPIAPQYPIEAARLGTEGWVDLAFTVLPNGRTSGVRVLDSTPHKVFDSAAKNALAAARYEPTPKGAPQVARDARVRLTFKLHD
jgi:TonB family protein